MTALVIGGAIAFVLCLSFYFTHGIDSEEVNQ